MASLLTIPAPGALSATQLVQIARYESDVRVVVRRCWLDLDSYLQALGLAAEALRDGVRS